VRSGRERLFEAPSPVAAPVPAAGEIPLEDLPTFADLARDLRQGDAAPAAAAPAAPPSPPIDLLAEILADDELGAGQDETAQVSTIVDEIGSQVGGDQAKDPESQYNLGLVYLEMELIDQAADCFASAAMSPEHALRSYEMWGIALVRQERFEEAIDVLGRGLRTPGAQPEDLLGLLYHTGDAYERAGRLGAAREYYERVYQISPQFLDTERRLETLEA
jgi:tetratricopeptide (TPR) repeat protein